MGGKRVGLGVNIDVSRVHSEWALVVSTKWHRCLSILTMLRDAKDGNYLPPAISSTIFGKLSFILKTAYGRAGRAAAQPLMQRVWYDNTHDFTPALAHMLEFYEALLPLLPALRIPIYDVGTPQSSSTPMPRFTARRTERRYPIWDTKYSTRPSGSKPPYPALLYPLSLTATGLSQ